MMRRTPEKRLSRREFLRAAGRNVALGLLGAAAVALLLRRRGGQACGNGEWCRSCAALDRCRLPQATRTKRQGREHPS
ncbi:MAG: hypothetical protein WBF17_01075 [Phycisphaerae bacterium]